MLLELSIKNFAIIDDLTVSFSEGLNVITGETGSGKSIIIDALGIVLGARASKDVIKKGSERAFIEATFFDSNHTCDEMLDAMGIEVTDLITISKEINLKRPSISRVNGHVVTNTNLNKITDVLIDIFAQHESQSLMNVNNQKKIIDSFGDGQHLYYLQDLNNLFSQYSAIKEDYETKSREIIDKDREIDLLQYQIDEIASANLTEDDEHELESELKKATNSSKIIEDVSKVVSSFRSDYSNEGVTDVIDKNISILEELSNYDSNFEEFNGELQSIRFALSDIASSLESYLSQIDIDEDRLNYLNDRMNTVHTLKRKYGNTIEEIYKYFGEISFRMEFLQNYESRLKDMEQKLESYKSEMQSIAEHISDKRKNISSKLEVSISSQLRDLNIEHARFKVQIKDKEIGRDGKDLIEFYISTNIGQDLKPMAEVASGGEMSRIMLGFKSITAEKDEIQTLIFDEIDTGISGKTAQIVGKKISEISKSRQVIVISHLPQIVAMADEHFLIEKSTKEDRTFSNIIKLSFEERVVELARLIGGFDSSEKVLDTARELITSNKK